MHKRNPPSTPRREPRVKTTFRLSLAILAALDAAEVKQVTITKVKG